MAITQNPITGKMTKTAGGMIFSKRGKKNTMRSKPFQVKDAKTEEQIEVRIQFDIVSKLAKMINGNEVLKEVFNDSFADKTNFHANFQKFLSPHLKVEAGKVKLDFKKEKTFNDGKGVAVVNCVKNSPFNFTVTWEESFFASDARKLQPIYIHFLSLASGDAVTISTASVWEDKSATVDVPQWFDLDGDVIVMASPRRPSCYVYGVCPNCISCKGDLVAFDNLM